MPHDQHGHERGNDSANKKQERRVKDTTSPAARGRALDDLTRRTFALHRQKTSQRPVEIDPEFTQRPVLKLLVPALLRRSGSRASSTAREGGIEVSQ